MITSFEDKEDRPKNKGKKGEKKFKPPKKITEKYLYNAGLAYLQRFPASSSHFKSIMMRRVNKSCRHHVDQNMEDCVTLLDKTIVKFQELGLLDDTAYLKGMVTSLRRRGLAAFQIEMKLKQKGLDSSAIKNTLNDFDTDEFDSNENGDIYAALIFIRKKRLGPYDLTARYTPEKSLAAMARAGYSYDIAKKVLEMDDSEREEKLMRLSSL
jgi:regulatory protein